LLVYSKLSNGTTATSEHVAVQYDIEPLPTIDVSLLVVIVGYKNVDGDHYPLSNVVIVGHWPFSCPFEHYQMDGLPGREPCRPAAAAENRDIPRHPSATWHGRCLRPCRPAAIRQNFMKPVITDAMTHPLFPRFPQRRTGAATGAKRQAMWAVPSRHHDVVAPRRS
jgi:hypothetical protein